MVRQRQRAAAAAGNDDSKQESHVEKSGRRSRSLSLDKHEATSSSSSSVVLPPDWKTDWDSILLLLLLYTLQGIPMGLSSSIPFLLQSKVGYADQATFSLVSWPFSLKLLWAPLVDSLYVPAFGRRKSWLVPVQLLCGVFMTYGSSFVQTFLAEDNDSLKPDVPSLTIYFFIIYFLMATQDIAVDGWALTMLSRRNVSYASTCNSVGQTLGYFIAYVGFLALHDPVTCNTYFRSTVEDVGIVTLPGFISFWGYVMLFTTIGVWALKTEKQPESSSHQNLSVKETYQQLLAMAKLPAIISLSVILLTCKIGFAAAESVAPLKLVEYGLQKEKLAMLSPVLIPLGIIIPMLLSRYAIDSRYPLRLFLIGYPLRLVVGILYAAIVYYTPSVMSHNDEGVHYYYYCFILASGALHELASNMMFIPMMSFYSLISDPSIGGTYMTFLNTIANMGSKWPNSLALRFVDVLSVYECENCTKITRDGFFVETLICVTIGVVWFAFFYKRIVHIQHLKKKAWRVRI